MQNIFPQFLTAHPAIVPSLIPIYSKTDDHDAYLYMYHRWIRMKNKYLNFIFEVPQKDTIYFYKKFWNPKLLVTITLVVQANATMVFSLIFLRGS